MQIQVGLVLSWLCPSALLAAVANLLQTSGGETKGQHFAGSPLSTVREGALSLPQPRSRKNCPPAAEAMLSHLPKLMAVTQGGPASKHINGAFTSP